MKDAFQHCLDLMTQAGVPEGPAVLSLMRAQTEAFQRGEEIGLREIATIKQAAKNVTMNLVQLARKSNDPWLASLEPLFLDAIGIETASAYTESIQRRGDIPTVLAWQAFFEKLIEGFSAAVDQEVERLQLAEATAHTAKNLEPELNPK